MLNISRSSTVNLRKDISRERRRRRVGGGGVRTWHSYLPLHIMCINNVYKKQNEQRSLYITQCVPGKLYYYRTAMKLVAAVARLLSRRNNSRPYNTTDAEKRRAFIQTTVCHTLTNGRKCLHIFIIYGAHTL